jgi:RNA polymerase sigma-70 factor, ECF subfamily
VDHATADASPPVTTVLPSDRELVARARAGDTAAFEELVRRHRDRIYRVALRVCRHPADAEDVTQEAIVRAWRGLGTFRGDAEFTTWLYRIVTNLALNRVTRRREHATERVPEPAGPGEALDPARRAEDRERLDAALAALDTLTAEQRACYVLREVEGLTYEELAEVLDISVASVKGRLYRARQDLVAALERYDATGGDRS